MTTLIKNIKQLINCRESHEMIRGQALSVLPCIDDAFLLIEDGLIADYGAMADLENKYLVLPKDVVDASGKLVLPSWCDSHTHLVFAGSRENEFVDKIKGMSYADIAARGGGIINSAKLLNETSEDDLFTSSMKKLDELSRLGTGAIEIKSGYGLSVDGELKMLRVIKRLKQYSDVIIKSSFLAAHTYPPEFKENHQGYIDSIINEMLPVIAAEKLADYIDVFCEEGFFSVEEMETICMAGMQYGLKPKLHVNQLNSFGAVQAGIKLGAVSLDHLETMSADDIKEIGRAEVVATLLPTAAFFLRMPMQPAREMIDAGAAIALASDYNPGSSPSGNMNFVLSISCIQMRLLPEEAINAATLNGAYAMELADKAGTITKGKVANIILTKPLSSLAFLPYAFGSNLIERVMLKGNWLQ